jgi:3-oxoacyl-(acyl-carrier-protein) synthase
MEQAIASGKPAGRFVPDFRFEEVVPFGDPRGLDPSSRYLTAAVARAISDACITIRGDARDRSGLFVGSIALSSFSSDALLVSTYPRGLENVSASAFTRIVINAPAGACSSILSLKGPTTTISAGEGCGLLAIAQAAEYMSRRSDVDAIFAGGVDELDRGTVGVTPAHAAQKLAATPDQYKHLNTEGAEGAACLLLASGSSAFAQRPGVPRVDLAGWGFAGPGCLRVAVDEALAMGGISLDQIGGVFGIDRTQQWAAIAETVGMDRHTVDVTGILGDAPSTVTVLAAVHALISLRRGDIRHALVISAAGTAATTALVFTRNVGDIQ